jgi:hypothetical protein
MVLFMRINSEYTAIHIKVQFIQFCSPSLSPQTVNTMTIQAIAFDVYGTLFDVYSIGVLAKRLFPGKGTALAELWRDKQIEYTRLRTICSAALLQFAQRNLTAAP